MSRCLEARGFCYAFDRTILRQMSSSETVCANVVGHRLLSEEEIPVAVRHQLPPTQQKRGSNWEQTCRPSAPEQLTGQQFSLPVWNVRMPKTSYLSPPCKEAMAQGSDHPAQGHSLIERETEALGFREKVIALKSLSKWVLQLSQDKSRQEKVLTQGRQQCQHTLVTVVFILNPLCLVLAQV